MTSVGKPEDEGPFGRNWRKISNMKLDPKKKVRWVSVDGINLT
jgi:hypothetical protein